MKKIKILSLLFLIVNFGCTKEVEFGNNFEFKITGVNNTPITVLVEKNIVLEFSNIIGKESSDDYLVSYTSGANDIDVIDAGQTFIKNKEYNYTINSDKQILLKIKPKVVGTIPITFTVKNNMGTTKTFTFEVISENLVVDYSFSATSTNLNPFIGVNIPIELNVLNGLNSVGTNYQIKYTSTNQGVFKIGTATLPTNGTYTTLPYGISAATFICNTIGLNSVTLTSKNSTGIEKTVIINFDFQDNAFFTLNASTNTIDKPQYLPFDIATTITNINGTTITGFEIGYTCSSVGTMKLNGVTISPSASGSFTFVPCNQGTFNLTFVTNVIGLANFDVFVKNANNIIKHKLFSVNITDNTFRLIENPATNQSTPAQGMATYIQGTSGLTEQTIIGEGQMVPERRNYILAPIHIENVFPGHNLKIKYSSTKPISITQMAFTGFNTVPIQENIEYDYQAVNTTNYISWYMIKSTTAESLQITFTVRDVQFNISKTFVSTINIVPKPTVSGVYENSMPGISNVNYNISSSYAAQFHSIVAYEFSIWNNHDNVSNTWNAPAVNIWSQSAFYPCPFAFQNGYARVKDDLENWSDVREFQHQ